jgi:hypothetical protein
MTTIWCHEDILTLLLLLIWQFLDHRSHGYSMKSPLFLCHSSMLFSPYCSWTLLLPSGHLTHSGLLSPITHTISLGTGSYVSIADAKGWISSGQVWSHNHSMVEQSPQKLRSEVHFSAFGFPRSLVATYILVSISTTRKI